MNNFNVWKGGGSWTYAFSIAATWIWAPAIFVSFTQAHDYGIWGVLWFLVPNMLTLILFGWIVQHFGITIKGENLAHALQGASLAQKNVHKLVSTLLLVCSTVVQFVGIYAVWEYVTPSSLIPYGKELVILIVAIYCGFSTLEGIVGVIINDWLKYWIILASGVFIVNYAVGNFEFIGLGGVKNPTCWEVAKNFGITASIGLFCAPYIDSTFWQRAFCIPFCKTFSTFVKGALAFAVVPCMFAITGFFLPVDLFTSSKDSPIGLALFFAVFLALMATIDSNFVAIVSLWEENLKKLSIREKARQRGLMGGLLVVSSILFLATDMNVTEWFLFYGTARSALFVPTILILTRHYRQWILLLSTLAAVIIGSLGYAATQSFWWTLFAILFPLIAWKPLSHGDDYALSLNK